LLLLSSLGSLFLADALHLMRDCQGNAGLCASFGFAVDELTGDSGEIAEMVLCKMINRVPGFSQEAVRVLRKTINEISGFSQEAV
jgi:hypothetical protein